jgi:undecaprenyl-diphosphatase
MFQSIILGIVQGLTEFLPVSSTAHLVVLPMLFGWDGDLVNSLSFDVALHAGTLLSVLYCFYPDLLEMLRDRKKRPMVRLLVVGTIPAGLAGVTMHDHISGALRSPWVIVASLVVFAVVMYAADRYGRRKRGLVSMNTGEAIWIGLAQAVALVPGVSRSGITISAALERGFKRREAARFSFLLSIPVIAGAAVLEAPGAFSSGGLDAGAGPIAAGFLSAFVTGVVAIRFMLNLLQSRGLGIFVIYRFILAGVIGGWLWLAG